jgi:hypothetical protein
VIFHPFFTALADTQRIIHVDLHGRGRSDRHAHLAALGLADGVADVAELIGALPLRPRTPLRASCGGLLGQALDPVVRRTTDKPVRNVEAPPQVGLLSSSGDSISPADPPPESEPRPEPE